MLSKYTRHALVVALLFVCSVAQAQWATFDAANYAQNLAQVQDLQKSLSQLNNQLNELRSQTAQAKQAYSAVTGTRNLGSLVKDSVGDYQSQVVSDGLNGSGQIAQLAAQIKQQAGYLSTQNMGSISDAARQSIQRSGDQAATNQAMSQAVFQHSADEFKNIQALMSRIDTAQDPKAIQDLQARIAVQQASLQNQSNQAQAMLATMQAQRSVQEEKDMQTMLSEPRDYSRGNN